MYREYTLLLIKLVYSPSQQRLLNSLHITTARECSLPLLYSIACTFYIAKYIANKCNIQRLLISAPFPTYNVLSSCTEFLLPGGV